MKSGERRKRGRGRRIRKEEVREKKGGRRKGVDLMRKRKWRWR